MLQYLVILGFIVNVLGSLHYIRETIRGTTKPNRVTWLMWSIAPMIATVAGLASGAGWAVLPVFTSGFGPLLVLIFSFVNKNSYWQLGKLDYGCGVLSSLAIVLWIITKDPVVAIVFAIVSDLLAAVPTLIKGWKFPETESGGPFITGLFNALTTFFAIKTWGFAEYAFPVYLVLINISLLVSIYRKRFFRTN